MKERRPENVGTGEGADGVSPAPRRRRDPSPPRSPGCATVRQPAPGRASAGRRPGLWGALIGRRSGITLPWQ